MSVSVDDITKISHQFSVKWNISFQELIEFADSSKDIVLKSNRYRFKNILNLEFSYELFHVENYQMRVNCKTDMPMFLEDALILVEDSVYRVKCTFTNTLGRLVFNRNVLLKTKFVDDIVTIHCIMWIPAEVRAVITYPEKDKTAVNLVECETIVTYPDLYPHGLDEVNKFRYSSRIPDFNVKTALGMMIEAHQRHNPILKALCSEYLMENLTTENAAEVLKQAINSDARDLLQKCGDFLINQCKIVSRFI